MTAADIIFVTNEYISYILILPLLLNLKYYYQMRIKDDLYVAIFFLCIILSYLQIINGLEFRNNDNTGQIPYSFYYLSSFFIIQIAIRTKWEKSPVWASLISYAYIVMSIINQFLEPYQFVGNFWIGQFIFNPLNIVSAGFVLYCFLTSQAADILSPRARTSRYFWIVYTFLLGFQDLLFYFLVVLPDVPFGDEPFCLILVLQGNYLITNLVIFILHTFFPEAVLISQEQVVRAFKHYNEYDVPEDFVGRLGVSQIQSYMDTAKSVVIEKKLEDG